MQSFTLRSRQREEFIDITQALGEAAARLGGDGALHVYCPHTTCGLTINEGADPDVCADLLRFFSECAPRSHGWRHAESNSDAHIKASLLGASLLLPMRDGRLLLGRWQSVYLFEGDGPRERTVWLQQLAEK